MSERFLLVYNKDELGYMIIDTEDDLRDEIHAWNLLCDLLNKQDKRIKELEKEVVYQKKYIREEWKTQNNFLNENNQLKEQLKYYKGTKLGYFVEEIRQLQQWVKEVNENLQQLYSHLGVETFGEDIQEQAVKEIDKLNQQDKHIKEFEDFMKEEEFTGLEDLKAYIKLQSNAFKNLIQENQQLKQSLENLQKLNGEIITLNRTVIKDSQILDKENEQLKQSQKQKME